jgi:hypothetical protein
MSARNHEQELERYLRGDGAVSRAYRAAADAKPSAHLDSAIQAAARRAVGSRPRTAFSPFGRHWMVPTAAAAVLVLGVGLVTFLAREGVPVSPGEATKELPAETADKREATRLESLGAGSAPPASSTATPDSKQVPALARDEAAVKERKLSEAASVAESPAARVAAGEVAPTKARKVGSEAEAGAPPPTLERPRGDAQRRVSPGARGSTSASGDLAAGGVATTPQTATTLADVLSVSTSGPAGAYQLAVTVRSPDTGCQQYADWWEVLSEDGRLLYRRVLLHSHVDEQPFTRSGGPVAIGPDTVVWVRAHMHPSGYGGSAMRGSASLGFRSAALAAGFGAQLAQQLPLPGNCDF